MKSLLVATSFTPTGAEREVQVQARQRIDYIELAQLADHTDYVDFAHIPAPGAALQFVQARAKLDLRLALHVAVLVRRGGYGLVVSLSERVGIPLAYMLPAGITHIVQLHHPLSNVKLRILRALRVPNKWSLSIVYTHAEAQALQALLRCGSDKIRHLPHPVDTKFFRPYSTPALAASTALSVGLSHRDYSTLLGALRLTPSITCDVYAASTWVGGGVDSRRQPIPANARVRAYIHPRELRERYSASQFVIVPIGHTTQWSAGVNAVLEAQAMGKPVIASRTPGLSEYVVDGETGLLVDPGDVAGLARAMRYLADRPQEAASMGARARAWVEARFSLDGWLSEYGALLTDFRGRRAR